MFAFKCPGCSDSRQLPDRVIGRKFRCPSCKIKVKHFPDGRVEIRDQTPGPTSNNPPDVESVDDVPEISLPAAPLVYSPTTPGTSPGRFIPGSLAGTIVGNYKLLGHIGSGSGGHVYLAEHLTLKRKMAVKLLAPAQAPSPERVERLSQEAVALAKVDHPNVVHVYDFWIENGNPYIAMQFVDGPSLDQAIQAGGPFPSERLVKLAHDLLLGLEVIHQAGLLHRDIKPSNVLLTKEGEARLADFGLAWEMPQVSELPSNVFSGTAEYAAPELAVGQAPDARTDLYALGGTLYKAATGRPPYSGNTVAEKLKKQLYEPLASPRGVNPKVSPVFEAFLVKLLTKEREGRPATAREALRLLAPVGGVQPKSTRRVLKVRTTSSSIAPVLIAGAVLAGALGVLAYFGTRPKPADLPKEAERKVGIAKAAPPEPAPEPRPKQPGPVSDPFEQSDFNTLEHLLLTGSTNDGIDGCTEFLSKHPKSSYCEWVLIKKMELQQDLARQTGKSAPRPVADAAPKPALAATKEPPKSIAPLKRSTKGVPCRPLPDSVREGLHWLARHQTETGYWDVLRYGQHCVGRTVCGYKQEPGNGVFQVGVTSLSALAFLGAGIGLHARDEVEGTNLGDALRESVRFLVRSQGPDGRIGEGNLPKQTYCQALAVNALAEAVRSLSSGTGFPEEESRKLRLGLDAATQYLISCQNPGAGWRYGYRPGDSDSSVTAACLLALHAARRAGARVAEHAFEGGLDWFQKATEPSEKVGYNARGTGKVYVPGQNEQYDDHPTLTAAAGVCRYLLGRDHKTSARLASRMVAKDLPMTTMWGKDFYYWYYGTRFALVAFEPRDVDAWRSSVVAALTQSQSAESGTCRRGAWIPNDRWGREGGRIYATAINTLTLEYATLPKHFDFGAAREPDVVAARAPAWIFKLKSGGKVQGLSFEEQPESYMVKVAGGSIKLPKDDVEQILMADSPIK